MSRTGFEWRGGNVAVASDLYLPAFLGLSDGLGGMPMQYLKDHECEEDQCDVTDHHLVDLTLPGFQAGELSGIAEDRLNLHWTKH